MSELGDIDRVLAALPEDGSAIVGDGLVNRLGLPHRRVWSALAVLCTERRAHVEKLRGVTWAKRVKEGEAA